MAGFLFIIYRHRIKAFSNHFDNFKKSIHENDQKITQPFQEIYINPAVVFAVGWYHGDHCQCAERPWKWKQKPKYP